MRWLIAAVGLLLVVPCAQAQDEAKKLYEAMEQKLSNAKVHKVDFETFSTTQSGLFDSHTLQIKGSFVIAPGGLVRIAFEGKSDEKESKVTWWSDGKKMLVHTETGGKSIKNPADAPEKLYQGLASVAIRTSLTQSINASIRNPKPIDFSTQKPFGFKNVGKEKVGDKEANVIEYKLKTPDAGNVITCVLSLDIKSNLPLQRVVTVESSTGNLLMLVAEGYSSWQLDPKLPDGTFVLPK